MFKSFLVSILLIAAFVHPNQILAQEYYPLTEEGTFLTFPEWYIVFSSQEYAEFLKTGRPSQFNYLDSIKTYWEAYYKVTKATIDRGYPFNWGGHLMLGVIGVSYTGEYLIKSAYENTVGAASEKSANYQKTFEDLYAEKVAYEYGEFLTHTPWYDFPFNQKLKELWTQTPALSEYPYRSIERKVALSIEYEFKALYGALMHYGTNFVYAPANPVVLVKTLGVRPEILEKEVEVKVTEGSGSGELTVSIPRYKTFSEIAPRLLLKDVQFLEIAGNKNILITAIGDNDKNPETSAEVLFETPIYSDQSKKRLVLVVAVLDLRDVVKKLESEGFKVEHLFDY